MNHYAVENLFGIEGLNIAWYGIIITFGMILGFMLALRRCKKTGVEPDHLYNLVLWLIPVCILCARAYYVLFEWEQYKDNLLSVFQINKGGLAIYALKACRLSRCPPNPVPKSKDRRLLHLFSAWFLHRTKWCPAEPTPTNRGCQTVPHPPVTALHRRFSHKEYYQNSAV